MYICCLCPKQFQNVENKCIHLVLWVSSCSPLSKCWEVKSHAPLFWCNHLQIWKHMTPRLQTQRQMLMLALASKTFATLTFYPWWVAPQSSCWWILQLRGTESVSCRQPLHRWRSARWTCTSSSCGPLGEWRSWEETPPLDCSCWTLQGSWVGSLIWEGSRDRCCSPPLSAEPEPCGLPRLELNERAQMDGSSLLLH